MDVRSKFVYVYLVKSKDQVFEKFQNYVAFVKNFQQSARGLVYCMSEFQRFSIVAMSSKGSWSKRELNIKLLPFIPSAIWSSEPLRGIKWCVAYSCERDFQTPAGQGR